MMIMLGLSSVLVFHSLIVMIGPSVQRWHTMTNKENFVKESSLAAIAGIHNKLTALLHKLLEGKLKIMKYFKVGTAFILN